MSIREQLEESQKVCSTATDGPWEARGGYQSVDVTVKDEGEARIARFGDPLDTQQWKNATFIAHARTTLPLRNAQLAAVLDRLDKHWQYASEHAGLEAYDYVEELVEEVRRAIEDAAP